MATHIENREQIIEALKEELVGPSPQGEEINCSDTINFDTVKEFYKPWKQKGLGEEILQRDKPTSRYGVGVLYPLGTLMEDESSQTGKVDNSGDEENKDGEDFTTDEQVKSAEKIEKRENIRGSSEQEPDDFELSTANSLKPSSMGISFLAEFPEGSELVVKVTGGRYYKKKVSVNDKDREWWLREPVSINARFSESDLCFDGEGLVKSSSLEEENTKGLDINLEVFSRQHLNSRTRLLTVCIVNRSSSESTKEEYNGYDSICLFQSWLKTRVESPDKKAHILPYPGLSPEEMEEEEQSLALLYKESQTYAIGHGCAADWEVFDVDKAQWVSAESLPVYESPNTTPEIKRKDGTKVDVSMASLAGLVPGDNGIDALKEIIQLYKNWIEQKKSEIHSLYKGYQKPAQKHVEECERCVERMEDGLDYLWNDKNAWRAFQLANHAMLLQQLQGRRKPRKAQFDSKISSYIFEGEYIEPDPLNTGENQGKWRPFQIAFFLMSLYSAADGKIPDRRVVELIWFPTGGGKTEAYLGLAAFSMFMRRLVDPSDTGVNVLMRYTLRLLTAQQFQRASALICAMDYLRRKTKDNLGESEFSIGIWLGGSTTPNKRDQAVEALNKLRKSSKEENLFVIGQCPWCGAEMGRYKGPPPKNKRIPRVLGYEQKGNTVVFKCPDKHCEFSNGLPVYVVDEDIYEHRPSLVIGTVDKFAMLAWRPQARSIFGINLGGERDASPPELIIQDELHLISGPLGSMVGLYEVVIEELCTDRRGDTPVVPKIVSSTATIRKYTEQIKALYGRDDVVLFPPPGLDASDSFFSCYARDSSGNLLPGKKYVGVHAPGLGSIQTTQVRTFTALTQAPYSLNNEERDPWWSLLLFFNSLRELGTTLSLFQSDIPDYFKVLKNRLGVDFQEIRKLYNIQELTSRLRGDQVPEAIAELEKNCTSNKYPVDVCLASNIIEVGVDIDRLSLMSVVGQPKTTSQYIQVTGRVGRRWWEKTGIVVTIYGASKPRDRSHFEKFRSYHERLYAQVEPTSVTPFSPPALDRVLHAVMVSYVRQAGDEDIAKRPYPYPNDIIEHLRSIVLNRVNFIDNDEVENTKNVFDKRVRQWLKWEPTLWESMNSTDIPLLRRAGSYATKEQEYLSWPTPMSMRNVDAECRTKITTLYKQGGEGDE